MTNAPSRSFSGARSFCLDFFGDFFHQGKKLRLRGSGLIQKQGNELETLHKPLIMLACNKMIKFISDNSKLKLLIPNNHSRMGFQFRFGPEEHCVIQNHDRYRQHLADGFIG